MKLSKVVLTFYADERDAAPVPQRTITVGLDSIEFSDAKPYPREVRIAQRFYEYLKDGGAGDIPSAQ